MKGFGASAAFAAGSNLLGVRHDPYPAFNFHLEIEGLLAGAFSEVSGLEVGIEVEEYREGGRNDTVHKLPGPVHYPNLVLRRGLTWLEELWLWHQQVVAGRIERRNLTLFLLDTRLVPVVWWDVRAAYPVRWQGPDLRADTSAVAVESVELAHAGLSKPSSATAAGLAQGVAEAARRLL